MRKKGKFESGSRVLVSAKGHKTGSKLLMAFVSSFMSLLLCCTMFLSTTMAWFTDTVISAGNQIKIGTLAVDILYNGVSLNPEKTPHAGDLFDASLSWAPGKFVTRKLTIENSGDLDVNYMLNLVVWENPAVAAEFDVYVTDNPDVQSDTYTDRSSSDITQMGWKAAGKLTDLQASGFALQGELKAKQAKTFGIALYMRSDAQVQSGNETIFGKTFDVNVWLHATQTGAGEPSQKTLKMVRPTEAEAEPVETTVATEATEPQVKNTKKIMTQAKPTETTAPQTEPTETTAPQTEPTETTAPQTEPTETTAPQTEPTETTAPQTEPTTATTVPTEEPTETTVATTPTGNGQQ